MNSDGPAADQRPERRRKNSKPQLPGGLFGNSSSLGQESHEWLNLALEATVTSTWVFDVSSQQVSLNVNWSRMLGGPTVVTTKSVRQLFADVHPDDRKHVFDSLKDNLNETASEYSEEYRFKKFSGDWIWVHSKGKVTSRDTAGRPIWMIGTNTDITERKHAELARARHAEFLNALNQTTLSLLQLRDKIEILDELTRRVSQLLESNQVEVALLENDELVTYAGIGIVPTSKGTRTPRGQAILSWQAVDMMKPVVVTDYTSLPGHSVLFDEFQIGATAVFPIVHGNQCLGVLGVLRLRTGRSFSPEEQQHGVLPHRLPPLCFTMPPFMRQPGTKRNNAP